MISECCDDYFIMTHPIGAVPSAPRWNHGEKCKVRTNVSTRESRSFTSVKFPWYVQNRIHAMALIQIIGGNQHKTFGDLGKLYAKLLLQKFNKASTVIEVFHRYNTKRSIKAVELACRPGHDANKNICSVHGGYPVPPWKKSRKFPKTSNV